jgi:hypothetical protein
MVTHNPARILLSVCTEVSLHTSYWVHDPRWVRYHTLAWKRQNESNKLVWKSDTFYCALLTADSAILPVFVLFYAGDLKLRSNEPRNAEQKLTANIATILAIVHDLAFEYNAGKLIYVDHRKQKYSFLHIWAPCKELTPVAVAQY